MSKITIKQVQEARKYALQCYRLFASADARNQSELFNTYARAFAEYQRLDMKLFEQQIKGIENVK